MFTQAGFNTRRRFICTAFIARYGAGWMRASRLVRFASGEYAWDGGVGRISWPEQVWGICSLRAIDAGIKSHELPSSHLSARPGASRCP